jgi:hypothetical protein
MKQNTAIITGLFMLMILAFTIDPVFIYHFQNNLLGKAIVILVLIYLTMNNVTLGLLFTLAIILISSRVDIPMIEGLKNRKKKSAANKRKKIRNEKLRNEKLQTKTKCKTLEELLREERLKRMAKKASQNEEDINNDAVDAVDAVAADENGVDDSGIDRISVEETFRVRNPSTIPVTKEAFRVRQLNPTDNSSKYYGGSCSLI